MANVRRSVSRSRLALCALARAECFVPAMVDEAVREAAAVVSGAQADAVRAEVRPLADRCAPLLLSDHPALRGAGEGILQALAQGFAEADASRRAVAPVGPATEGAEAEPLSSATAASSSNDCKVLAQVAEQCSDPDARSDFVPKSFTLHFSTPFRARVVQVVLVDAMRGGSGPDDPDDPTRGVFQYWSLDGQLLADTDDGGLGLAADGRGVEILRLRGLLKAAREELAALKAAKGAPC